ncbi:MAG: FG-GAP repeat protein [Xanthomonadales bacterium]|nr:FG-GAP repeat protein [Xanthomonadales bacterium]
MPNPFNLASLDGSNGFSINGINESDFSGYAVSSAGDVNDDGVDDIIIGAWRADSNGNQNSGSSYVVYGDDTIFKNSFD